MEGKKTNFFINSLPSKNGKELLFLGYTIIGRLTKDELSKLKNVTSILLKKNVKYDSKELTNLINSKLIATKLESNNIVNNYHSRIVKTKMDCTHVDVFPVAHILKPFGRKGDIWHQDASIVDERYDFSLNAWTPLVNSNRLNGCIWVLPGSHISEVNFRQFGYNPIENETAKILKKHMIPIHVKAGEILLFYRNLIHGSSVNYLPKTRIAVESIIVPKNVQFYNYHRDEALLKDNILAYKVDMEHFLRQVPKQDFYEGKYEFEVFPDYGKEWVKDYLLKNISYFKKHENQFYSQIS